MQIRTFAIVLITTASAFAAEGVPAAPAVTVHEWGTFTSVARADGQPVYWTPLATPGDLPCFVNRLGPWNRKVAMPFDPTAVGMATTRMETPVLYFYSARKQTLSVHVDFPHGLITEWFPAATVTPAGSTAVLKNGRIDWPSVEVSPDDTTPLRQGQGASHYYFARHSDATPIRVGAQHDKLLFYRGIGNLPVPLEPQFVSDHELEVRGATVPFAILFERRGERMGYRLINGNRVETPELTGNITDLRATLADALTRAGLYPKEADAMLETWGDSWFEEGMRIVYLVPRATVDAQLPLTIKPAPAGIERVFVGRIEVLSPATRQTIESAMAAGNLATLQTYGRFLSPFVLEMMKERPLAQAPATAVFLKAQHEASMRERNNPSCVQ